MRLTGEVAYLARTMTIDHVPARSPASALAEVQRIFEQELVRDGRNRKRCRPTAPAAAPGSTPSCCTSRHEPVVLAQQAGCGVLPSRGNYTFRNNSSM